MLHAQRGTSGWLRPAASYHRPTLSAPAVFAIPLSQIASKSTWSGYRLQGRCLFSWMIWRQRSRA